MLFTTILAQFSCPCRFDRKRPTLHHPTLLLALAADTLTSVSCWNNFVRCSFNNHHLLVLQSSLISAKGHAYVAWSEERWRGGGGRGETNKKRCFPCLSTCVVLPCNSGTPLCVSLVVCSIVNRLLMWSYQWLLNKVPNLLALIIMIRMLPMLFCMFYGSYFCNL